MAIDYPLGVGQGNFPSVYGRFYAQDYGSELWRAQNRWIAPHSIYFLVLAEYGFIGLGMLLYLLICNMLTNRRTRDLSSRAHEKQKETIYNFSNACNSSMVAYSIGGIFLGGLNYPTLYFLTAMTLASKVIVRKEIV
jgi:O-antigen ligase